MNEVYLNSNTDVHIYIQKLNKGDYWIDGFWYDTVAKQM